MRKSKYVQSDTSRVYSDIKNILKNSDAPVLFSGCPCQVAGLYAFLGADYDNLITADLICHCVPSPKALKAYVDEVAAGRKVTRLDFRPKKEFGWECSTTYFEFDDGTTFFDEEISRQWYVGFLHNLITRPCCGVCPYADVKRVGDITLGDFWGIHHKNPNWSSPKGTSLVIANNPKGQRVFDDLHKNLSLCEPVPTDFSKPYNGRLFRPGNHNPNRAIFFKHLDSRGYFESIRYAQKMHFDAGIMGWWDGPNYGSKLTYYALYRFLELAGYSPVMIWPPHIPRYQFSDFAKNHYRISQYRPVDKMWDLNQYCDSFIVGSDQYWNYRLDNYEHFRMLNFAGESNKKISYATSFGHDKLFFPPHILEEAVFFMRRLDYVSVREADAVRIARDTFGVEATRVIDPAFIIDKSEYDALAEKAVHKTSDKYILGYYLDPDNDKKKALKQAADTFGLKTVSIVDIQGYAGKKEFMQDCNVLSDPQPTVYDWLYQFQNAEYVVTDSFHGACFAIIYNKPFVAYRNTRRGGGPDTPFSITSDFLTE